MSEIYYIYVVPHYVVRHSFDSNAKRDTVSPDWEAIDYHNGTYETPYAGYTDFKRQISQEGRVWNIIFRKYEIINSFIFILKSFDPVYKEENLEESLKNSDKVFNEIIAESGLRGISPIEPIVLRNLGTNEDFNENDKSLRHIFFEKAGDNKILCLNRFSYFLKIDFDLHLSNAIIDDIITLLFLSKIALNFSFKFLRDDEGKKNDSVNAIKTLWGYKFFLLKCPAIILFPSFFEKEIAIIDNLLDCRSMDLVENQNNRLDKIHKVEGGILVLTVFIMIDIEYRIFCDALKLYPILSLALAIVIAIIILLMQEIMSNETWNRCLEAVSKLRG